MKTRFVDEKTGIPYTLVGDYYLPLNMSAPLDTASRRG